MSIPKVLLLLSGLLFLTLYSVLAMTTEVKQSATMVATENPQVVQALVSRTACTMAKTNGVAAYYYTEYQAGVGTYTYFNPALMCPTPTYPFEISSFSFTLGDPGGYIWPVMVDVVVYALAQAPNYCGDPGVELCRYLVTADSSTYAYPTVGTYTFPAPCYVEGPVYIGLEYRDGAEGSTPSVMFDNNAASVVCDNWMRRYDGPYYEWYDFWMSPVPGYPIFWVGGETPCAWQPGHPYKMHFPQLPNDTGWDVNATAPLVLADDWQCSQTGAVKEIHFWGSWKNGVVGRILYFVLSVRSDIPANPPQIPYSRPDQTLWERDISEFTVNPVDPPSLEGWYDPSTGETLPNDHGAYFQYNICLDNEIDWFLQEQGTIYWLNISAVLEDPQNTQWGWKSTLNPFKDAAVWAGQLDWVELWEPSHPIQNQFYAQVDPQGMLMGGGTDYYGQGWYKYESGWWNIWFYDHPFTYDRKKVIRIEFGLSKLIPTTPSSVVFAVNWSTDRWSLVPQQDSMPPLPGVSEELYIGRDTLLVGPDLAGYYGIDYVIQDYNPEWVSVDIMGSNLMVVGAITHDCRQSLDLSFVITGDALLCNCKPGDANGDNMFDISDVVYLIAYIFSGGSKPKPYDICSGDANKDCSTDISDAVYLIAYIFSGGTPPCACWEWLTKCGPPLRK